MKYIEALLDKITMYRLVLYYLIGLLLIACGLSISGGLDYSIGSIVSSVVVLTVICWVVNRVFRWAFAAPTNSESAFITALILALIITPVKGVDDYIFLAIAAMLAMASKFILAYRGKHIFNPAAIAVALTAILVGTSASWWVGNRYLFPAVVIGGLLIARKIQRLAMVITFLVVATVSVLVFSASGPGNTDVIGVLQRIVLHSSLAFLAFVMLTEPLTSPRRFKHQIIYASIAGVVFAPQFHVFGLYSTPELTLIAANIYAYLVSPKFSLLPKFIAKQTIARNIFDFHFQLKTPLNFTPGQYMEWTFPHPKSDSRGVRRYFTIASSPSEKELIIGVKFNSPSSSYKKAMLGINQDSVLSAGLLGGDFVMPNDLSRPLVFIAGGIGITPYRSMLKYMIDNGQRRSVSLIYSAQTTKDFAYVDIISEAQKTLGLRALYNLTDIKKLPPKWAGSTGYINNQTVSGIVKDLKSSLFYISGPTKMVHDTKAVLLKMGVVHKQIKTDLFSGYS